MIKKKTEEGLDDGLFDIPSYVKRPDLRPEEYPLMATIEEEIDNWKLIVNDLELYKELIAKGTDPLIAISALGLTIYPEIHDGIPHPVEILSFFCSCHEWGVYPPSWIMDELYQRFNQYILGNQTGKDRRRLGQFFGESARGNQSPYFRQKVFAGVMESACIAVDRFRFVHHLSRENAIGIVARRLESVQNNTAHNFDKGEAALEKKYKIWHKIHSAHLQDLWSKSPPSQEDTLSFLKTFPQDAFTGLPFIEALLKK